MRYPVRVDGRHVPWYAARSLRKLGLRRTGRRSFEGKVPERQFPALKSACRRYGLRYSIDNSLSRRGSGYRAAFFRKNPPPFMGMYFCAYCGRLLKPKDVTVDHLYPIGAAKRDPAVQSRLRRMGISDVNDVRNLVPACRSCNQKKGDRMGRWIRRGKSGRHPSVWVLRHSARLLLAGGVIIWLACGTPGLPGVSAWIKGMLRDASLVMRGLPGPS